MSLNIKNERTHALVRELAERTGATRTSAVEDAVRRRPQELKGEGGAAPRSPGRPAPEYPPEEVERRIAAMKRISAAFRAETTAQQREAMRDHADWLHDEWGLPR